MSIALVGCTSQLNRVMNSWLNHHYSDLVRSWGAPHRIVNDRYGGQVLIYYLSRHFTLPGFVQTQRSKDNTSSFSLFYPPQNISYSATRTFWVNSRGIIYKWAWDRY